MSKVLVTGAGGFIGSHLVERLVAEGAEARAFVEYDSRGSWGWLDEAAPEVIDAVEIIAGDIRDSHAVRQAMAVRPYEVQVPYGVVEIEGNEIRGLSEKPVTRHYINAGIYVLDPAALDMVPRDARFDMPQLFDACRNAGLSTQAYPVEEYWVDIGQIDDYRRANAEFAATF